jgi:starch phosphorylase
MKSIIPRFNAQRMLRDYVTKFYHPAQRQRKTMLQDDGINARQLADWKKKVKHCWPGVSIELVGTPPDHTHHDDTLPLRVAAHLNGLAAEDVIVECLVGQARSDTNGDNNFTVAQKAPLTSLDQNGDHVQFALDLLPQLSGLQYYKIRIYPFHPLLCHRFETGFMIWL